MSTTTAHAYTKNATFFEHLGRWLTWPRFIFLMVITFFLFSILFPFYWMVSSSFKTYAEIGGRAPVYIPAELRWDAYMNYLISGILPATSSIAFWSPSLLP